MRTLSTCHFNGFVPYTTILKQYHCSKNVVPPIVRQKFAF